MSERYAVAGGLLIECVDGGMVQMVLPDGRALRITAADALVLARDLDAAASLVELADHTSGGSAVE